MNKRVDINTDLGDNYKAELQDGPPEDGINTKEVHQKLQ